MMKEFEIFKNEKRMSKVMLSFGIILILFGVSMLFVEFTQNPSPSTSIISFVLNIVLGILFIIQHLQKKVFTKFFLRSDKEALEFYLPGMEHPDLISKNEISDISTNWDGITLTKNIDKYFVSFGNIPHTERKRIIDLFRGFVSGSLAIE